MGVARRPRQRIPSHVQRTLLWTFTWIIWWLTLHRRILGILIFEGTPVSFPKSLHRKYSRSLYPVRIGYAPCLVQKENNLVIWWRTFNGPCFRSLRIEGRRILWTVVYTKAAQFWIGVSFDSETWDISVTTLWMRQIFDRGFRFRFLWIESTLEGYYFTTLPRNFGGCHQVPHSFISHRPVNDEPEYFRCTETSRMPALRSIHTTDTTVQAVLKCQISFWVRE